MSHEELRSTGSIFEAKQLSRVQQCPTASERNMFWWHLLTTEQWGHPMKLILSIWPWAIVYRQCSQGGVMLPVALSHSSQTKPWHCIRQLKPLSGNADWISHPRGKRPQLVQCTTVLRARNDGQWTSTEKLWVYVTFSGKHLAGKTPVATCTTAVRCGYFGGLEHPNCSPMIPVLVFPIYFFFESFLNLARLPIFSSSVSSAASLLAQYITLAKGSGVFSSQTHPLPGSGQSLPKRPVSTHTVSYLPVYNLQHVHP